MRKKRTLEGASLEYQDLPDDEKKLYEDIKAFCAECRLNNIEITRQSVRSKFKCGIDLICTLMGIMEALEGANSTANDPSAEPPVPPEVAVFSAEQRIGADRFEQTMAHSFRNALADQEVSIRNEYLSEIDGGKAALRALSKRLADFETTTEELTEKVRDHKNVDAERDGILERTRVERDDANEQNKRLTAANAAANESLSHLNREVSDLRQLNSVLSEVKQERDMYRRDRDELTNTVGDLKTRLAVLAKGETHLLSMLVENRLDMEMLRKDHASVLATIQEQHAFDIGTAHRWIADLQKQLVEITSQAVG
jgi:chromosome segregation ATPase